MFSISAEEYEDYKRLKQREKELSNREKKVYNIERINASKKFEYVGKREGRRPPNASYFVVDKEKNLHKIRKDAKKELTSYIGNKELYLDFKDLTTIADKITVKKGPEKGTNVYIGNVSEINENVKFKVYGVLIALFSGGGYYVKQFAYYYDGLPNVEAVRKDFDFRTASKEDQEIENERERMLRKTINLKEIKRHIVSYLTGYAPHIVTITESLKKKIKKGKFPEIDPDISLNIGDRAIWIATEEIRDRKFPRYITESNYLTKNNKLQPFSSSYFLRKQDAINLVNVIGDVTRYKNKNDNCFINIIKNRYPKIECDIEHNKKGVSLNNAIEFIHNNRIPCIMYSVDGEIIYKNCYKGMKKMYSIIHDNHIYLIENKYITRQKKIKVYQSYESLESLNDKFTEIMAKNIMPTNVLVKQLSFNEKDDVGKFAVTSFVNFDVLHIFNNEAKYVKYISKKLGILDKIDGFTSLSNMHKIIDKLYKVKCDSFFPYAYTPTIYSFHTDEKYINKNRRIVTLDKNKCYSYILKNLPFLVSCDIRCHRINECNIKRVVDSFIYFIDNTYGIEERKPFGLFVDGIQMGYQIKRSLEFCGCEKFCGDSYDYCTQIIKIKCEIEAERVENTYNKVIIDLYNIKDTYIGEYDNVIKNHESIIKAIVNRMIGCFETGNVFNSKLRYENIPIKIKDDEDDDRILPAGFYDIGHYAYDENINFNRKRIDALPNKIYTRLPIAIQIKNDNKYMMHKKRLELHEEYGIKYEDFIQANTDSLSFYCDDDKIFDKITYDHNSKDLSGWKMTDFKYRISTDQIPDIINANDLLRFDTNTMSTLYNCYAGSGKTHTIINEIIPEILEESKKYIVLTKCHVALSRYRELGLNCNVLSRYDFRSEIPPVDCIIIDEFGLCDKKAHDFLLKCKLLDKRIICLGDFQQQFPVMHDNHFDNKYYLEKMFEHRFVNKKNYRNNFSPLCYENIIEGVVNYYDCQKYISSPPFDDNTQIICYRNKTAKKYNIKCLQKKGYYNNKLEQIKLLDGAKVLCNNNKYKDIGLYNKQQCVIKEELDDCYMIMYDKDKSPVKMLKEKCKISFSTDDKSASFIFGYCITTYCSQGQEYEKIYFAPEDEYFLLTSSRILYTVVSRLKEKKNSKIQKERLISSVMKLPIEDERIWPYMECIEYINNNKVKNTTINKIKVKDNVDSNTLQEYGCVDKSSTYKCFDQCYESKNKIKEKKHDIDNNIYNNYERNHSLINKYFYE